MIAGKNIIRNKTIGAMIALAFCHSSFAADSKGSFSIALENDLFGAGTDKHYTHGTEMSYVSDTYMPRWLRGLISYVPFHTITDETRFGWALGQKIYTPDNIEEEALILDDRPYAGWAYLSLGMTTEDIRDDHRHVDSIELIFGVVGPKSGAEDAQVKVHEIIGATEPMGWRHQLDNEYTVDLRYRRSWLYPIFGNNMDIIPNVGLTLGSSQRNFGTGVTLRLGSGLDSDFGPPLIRPSSTGTNYFKPSQTFYWYLFAGINATYVDYNVFLDGNRDGESHSVEREEGVANLQVGIVAGGGNWRLTLTNIRQSREFESQQESAEFGAIALAYRF